MASSKTDRSPSDDRPRDTTEAADVVLDLRGEEPLVDLRGAPSVRFSDPPAFEASSDTAGLRDVERRDGTQRARYVAVIVIAVLNVFDLITTYVAISLGAHEANPLVAWMISSRLIIFVKILICSALIFGALLATQRRRRVTLTGLCVAWAVVGVYSVVVLLNTVNVFSRLG